MRAGLRMMLTCFACLCCTLDEFVAAGGVFFPHHRYFCERGGREVAGEVRCV